MEKENYDIPGNESSECPSASGLERFCSTAKQMLSGYWRSVVLGYLACRYDFIRGVGDLGMIICRVAAKMHGAGSTLLDWEQNKLKTSF